MREIDELRALRVMCALSAPSLIPYQSMLPRIAQKARLAIFFCTVIKCFNAEDSTKCTSFILSTEVRHSLLSHEFLTAEC